MARRSGHTAAMVPASKTLLPALDHALAHAVVEDAIRTYFRKRRSRVPGFIEQCGRFSVSGALQTLYRHALGHDLWRAPLNAALAGPQLRPQRGERDLLSLAGRKQTAERLPRPRALLPGPR